MLYVLVELDKYHESIKKIRAMEGKSGVDVSKLWEDFTANFDHRGLGSPEYPDYVGPDAKKVNDPIVSGCIASGSFTLGDKQPDTTSPEYVKWQQERKRIEAKWNSRREAELNRFRLLYGGAEMWDIFLSMLKKDLGFVERTDVTHSEF